MNLAYGWVAQRAEFRCEYCRAPATLFNFNFEIEHILPLSRGGDDSPANLALACRACNAFKGSTVTGRDPATHAEVELFHPHRHRWDEHFRFEPQGAEVLGVTPIGRATAARLQLNHPMHVRARRAWMRLVEFP
ncbi:MAG TPA: HNH endonuclease [Phycisphaerae bacterium]|jgi:hypothetical protein